ncbi:MAG TPA: XrtA/PEP-CTERM system histidine kinase PrsK [Rhizomicrobium sp.]|nr:XrtA/PEP-CTERM system histidine kinase PrsK [Rhizomicrobium sp.]
MLLFEVCYGIGCFSFLVLIGLMLRTRPAEIGFRIIVVYVLTALWAFAAAIQYWESPGVAHVLDSIHGAAWIEFLALILASASSAKGNAENLFYRFAIPVLCVAAVANDLRFVTNSVGPTDLTATQVFLRIAMSVSGLLLVENLFRNTLPARRWQVIPLCIACGALFAYDLFVFVDATVIRVIDPVFLAGRGIVLALIVPPLVVGMARNDSWNIDIHVSRRIVFHTATLTVGGIFLLVAAGVASLIGQIPGDWGPILRLTFFVGSILALVAILSVTSLRSRLRRFLSENFFSARYDYRTEWMRSVSTLSGSADSDPLPRRAIRAVADVVDSPGGTLWLKDTNGDYRIVASQSMTFGNSISEPPNSAFISAFDEGRTVQTFKSSEYPGVTPLWAQQNADVWIAVPLSFSDHLSGFIVLAKPRAPLALNWESFDLLLAVANQAASWLSEERSARTLVESAALIEYGKRFSFVAHDVKNVSSQLEIMIANMRDFADRPDFRADMVRTMEASIKRLNSLLARLRPDSAVKSQKRLLDVGSVIHSVVNDWANSPVPVRADADAEVICDAISEQDLRSALTHLVTNAVEASRGGKEVFVSLQKDDRQAIIDIRDSGTGMDASFIQNELFAPLHSTKASGHGVGAFQARELIWAAGGGLEVSSAVGRGSLFRIILPAARSNETAHPTATALT